MLLEISNGFGLLVRWPEDPQERLLAFRVTGRDTDKINLIDQLSELLAQTNCSMTKVSHYKYYTASIMTPLEQLRGVFRGVLIPTVVQHVQW